jgi:hypothetical protein
MTRECPVRFCERLEVKLPGATLPTTIRSNTYKADTVIPIGYISSLIPNV